MASSVDPDQKSHSVQDCHSQGKSLENENFSRSGESQGNWQKQEKVSEFQSFLKTEMAMAGNRSRGKESDKKG